MSEQNPGTYITMIKTPREGVEVMYCVHADGSFSATAHVGSPLVKWTTDTHELCSGANLDDVIVRSKVATDQLVESIEARRREEKRAHDQWVAQREAYIQAIKNGWLVDD